MVLLVRSARPIRRRLAGERPDPSPGRGATPSPPGGGAGVGRTERSTPTPRGAGPAARRLLCGSVRGTGRSRTRGRRGRSGQAMSNRATKLPSGARTSCCVTGAGSPNSMMRRIAAASAGDSGRISSVHGSSTRRRRPRPIRPGARSARSAAAAMRAIVTRRRLTPSSTTCASSFDRQELGGVDDGTSCRGHREVRSVGCGRPHPEATGGAGRVPCGLPPRERA